MAYLETARRLVTERDPTGIGHERNEQREGEGLTVASPVGGVRDEKTKETTEDGAANADRGLSPFPSFLSSPFRQVVPGSPESLTDHDADLATTVANALALDDGERAAWQREIVDALRWVTAGHGRDPDLAHDLAALRKVVPPGTCIASDGPCPIGTGSGCVACLPPGSSE